MKWLSAGLLLFGAGCVSGDQPRWYSEPVNASSIDALTRSLDSEVTLRDGSTILLANPADYGDALCDRYACVRKAEISGIRIADHNGNNNDSMALAVLFAPVTIAASLVATGKMAHDGGGNGTANTSTVPAQPVLTPPSVDPELAALRLRDQQPPDNVQAEQDKSLGFLREECQPFLPADITTLDPALQWVHANRMAIPDGHCLNLAAGQTGRQKLPGYLDRELQLHILGMVRLQWQRVQCAGAIDIRRIVPLEDLKGASMSQLDFIRETLADEVSYVLPGNYAELCDSGLADATTTPDTRTFAAIVDPFSRPAAAPWLRDRRSDDLN